MLCSLKVGAQQSISDNFKNYQQQSFQEKIYIHTDKPAYTVGETVWLCAYRVDAMFHSSEYYSGVIFVVNNISYPENTTFVVPGFTGKKGELVEVEIDEPKFRLLDYSLLTPEINANVERRDREGDFLSR